MKHDLSREAIRVGTLVPAQERTEHYIQQILPHGFESLSITFWQTLGETDLKELAARVNEALGDSGVTISSVCVYGNPLENEEVDQHTRDAWAALIDHAHLFGADIVAGFAGRLRDKPIDESIPRFREVFGDLAKRAADRGVRLAFENCPMGGDWSRGDWNIAHNPRAWSMMFDAVPADNVGLQWEPCHQMCQLIDPMPQIETWCDRIFHVHGKDATIRWDFIRRHGIGGPEDSVFHRTPGFGDSNWTDIISELRRNSFRGSIDIEGWHDPVYRNDLEMTGQVRALEYLRECRGGFHVDNPKP